MSKGYFITFEGGDGCGKTTQLGLVEKYLKDKSYEVVTTREPGGQKLGLQLRQILLHYDGEVSSTCELFLYLADRAQHIDTVVRPALEKGFVVLCDRHTDSTLAYQGYARGLDLERLKTLNNIATGGLKPDLTLLYDVSSEVAQTRVGKEKDRLESEGMEFHEKVRQGYLSIAEEESARIKVLNANLGIEGVFEQTLKQINKLLNI